MCFIKALSETLGPTINNSFGIAPFGQAFQREFLSFLRLYALVKRSSDR